MQKIGMMQGRVIPAQLDRFQVFPDSNWEEELSKTKKIGFKYVEILYDKKLICKKLLQQPENMDKLGINPRVKNSGPAVHSICLDYLASISALNSWKTFSEEVEQIIQIIKNTTIKILVIPFFDENFIKSQEELEALLNLFREKSLDKTAMANDILIALELSLPAYQIRTLLEKYRLKNIKICYDIGNAKAEGYFPEHEIIELGDFICHVHIKDRRPNGPNVMLGKGQVNFKACFKALKKIDYKGLMIFETRFHSAPAIEAVKNLQFVEDLIKNS
jgi:sugar phosphate isomerase/epimerase